ncbi:MAG: hypothetical protein ABEJ46_06020 [Gemmatimonadota bacterium]
MNPTRPPARATAAALLVLLLPLSTGCYRYSAVQGGAPGADESVRVVVSPPAGEIERSEPRTYSGRVAELKADTLVLRVRRAGTAVSLPADERSRLLRIPRERIERMERQEVALLTSGGLVLGGGAAATLFLLGLSGEFSGGQDQVGDDVDSGDASLLPFLRISFP